MTILHARVKDGRFVVDEPAELPDGATVDLLLLDIEDSMSPEERAALDNSIERGLAQAARGETVPAREIIERLRKL